MSEETRLDALRRKLAAREREPAFASNCEALRLEIARLEAEAETQEKTNGS